MMYDKTYCINKDCPFKDCEFHVVQIKEFPGIYSFAGFDAICERYIRHVVSEVAE